MWEEIIDIRRTEGCKTWCMLEDFNAVRKPDERKGVSIGHASKKKILGFNEFIDKTEMLEIPFVGRKYTWYRPNGNAKSRIDIIFVFDKWLEHCPGYNQYIQDRQLYDHFVIVLKNSLIDWGPKPFKCLEVWNSEKRFRELVKQKLSDYTIEGDYMRAAKEKFKK